MVGEDDAEERVGIADSPAKGRRLMLFQETSDESFEESLMAGGYGRYRTIDWSAEQSASGGPQNISQIAGETLSAKDIKKYKRLQAFRDPSKPYTKLCPTEIEGRGRVLLDVSGDQALTLALQPARKRLSRRRRRAAAQQLTTSGTALHLDVMKGDAGPNWPDEKFPWRLRNEERAELARAEEEEKLRWIEKFLDRDTDEDDEQEEYVHCRPPDKYDAPTGGKRALARDHAATEPRPFSPIDTADARVMLRTHQSVQACVSRRQYAGRNDDEAVRCICGGRDEGGRVVQCDECLTWYHLLCLGIADKSELGKEEDLWYCHNCPRRTPEPELVSSVEPDFAPTHNEPFRATTTDVPFFQGPFKDSPLTPWTSVRPPRTPLRSSDSGPNFTSGSPSKPGPSTPRNPRAPPAQSTYGMYGSSFDPTSTPSRSFRPPGTFATPKSNLWGSRTPFAFHAPPSNLGMQGSTLYRDSGGGDGGRYGPGSSGYGVEGTPTRRPSGGTSSLNRSMDSPSGSRTTLGRSSVMQPHDRSDEVAGS